MERWNQSGPTAARSPVPTHAGTNGDGDRLHPAVARARCRLRTLPIDQFRFERAILWVQREECAARLADPALDPVERATLDAELVYFDLELAEADAWDAQLARAAEHAPPPGDPRREFAAYRRARQDLDLVAVIERFAGVRLTRRGKRWSARCMLPGHKDDTPSFTVYPDGHFFCFGCRRHGDALDFVREFFSLNSALEALRELQRVFPEVA